MVNMKLILLVSLVVIYTEAVPIQETSHNLVKRGIFGDIWQSARETLTNLGTEVEQHVDNAREEIQRSRDEALTNLNQIGDQLRSHADTLREHVQDHVQVIVE
ncbi:uncharacterized protein LOC117339266 isoform X2 [Pecten maximus]|uniref:uncharacterized protein LOC117339266 isoform X2 n=1 Tax=Pecten maximus TaxID=6579 RepID=UPI001458882B|nr:uncharacterized protein LOC117339266 isoform X2 [Pecten maximus]